MSVVEGAIAVKAVLASPYRKVNKVMIAKEKSSSDISFILAMAKKSNVKVERPSLEEIVTLAKGKTHGGILADVTERKTQSVTSLLRKDKPFLAFLEGIEDGFNLGYIMRTLYAFGCDGVILKERYIDYDDMTIIKSSAGASELIPIAYAKDLELSLDILKSNGIQIVSAYRGKNPVDLYDYDFTGKGLLVCIGGPLRGLSKVVLDQSDSFIYIPYENDFRNALNAASAASVIASEVYRQKRGK